MEVTLVDSAVARKLNRIRGINHCKFPTSIGACKNNLCYILRKVLVFYVHTMVKTVDIPIIEKATKIKNTFFQHIFIFLQVYHFGKDCQCQPYNVLGGVNFTLKIIRLSCFPMGRPKRI